MKYIIIAFCMASFFSGFAYSEEISTNSEKKLCPGVWILTHESGWAVRNDEGIILPLSPSTIVLGCQKNPIVLFPELAVAKAEILCEPSSIKYGLPDIISVTVICE